MNRLRYHFAYLAGAITYADDAGATWRKNITPALQAMGVIVLDPCHKPLDTTQLGFRDEGKEDVLRLNKMMEIDPDKAVKIMREIRHFDLRLVDRADFIVAHYDPAIQTVGTLEEIFTANRSKKPVLVMCPEGFKRAPMWLRGTLPRELFFNSWDNLLAYLRGINLGLIQDTLNRWVFFALNDQVEQIYWRTRPRDMTLSYEG